METGYKSENYCMGLKSCDSSPEASVSFLYIGAISLELRVWLLTFEGNSIIWNKNIVFLKVLYGPLHFLSGDLEHQGWHYIYLVFRMKHDASKVVLKWLIFILVFSALFVWRRMLKKSLAGNWFTEMCFVLQRKACCFLLCLGAAHRFSSCCFSH